MSGKQTGQAILAYHEVMLESSYSYCVTCSALREHLRMIDEDANTGRNLPAQVTFDDGEQSQFQHAFPLLAEHKTCATFFVTPGLIGTEPKFLSWGQLKQLQNAG